MTRVAARELHERASRVIRLQGARLDVEPPGEVEMLRDRRAAGASRARPRRRDDTQTAKQSAFR